MGDAINMIIHLNPVSFDSVYLTNVTKCQKHPPMIDTQYKEINVEMITHSHTT